ncbi:MAG: hypothetical protein ACX93O_04090 [Flagellimonas sp.]
MEEGLFFFSHEVKPEDRTSLNLTPNEPLHFENGISIEFEARFRDKDGYFGNIVNLIGNDEVRIGLVCNTNKIDISSEEANFWLVLNDSILMSFEWSDIPNGTLNEWMDFTITLDHANSNITLTINGEQTSKRIPDIQKFRDFKIIFGKIPINEVYNTDVAPMAIKQIKISDGDDEIKRHWTLGKHTQGEKVYDELYRHIAIVENPKWIIDQHVFWKKTDNFHFENLIGITEDVQGERIFFIDTKAVYVYSLKNKGIDTLAYTGNPYPCLENTVVYNPYKNELWSYSFDENVLNKFDFTNSKWSLDTPDCPEPSLWHHGKIISPRDSSLITFGGYGFFRYKSDIKNFNERLEQWNGLDIRDSIGPRHLNAVGALDESSFLVYGGYGSKSGRQVANVIYYYDLYSVDFSDFSVRKLWERDSLLSGPTVPVESMVVNSGLNSFYTLLYDNTNYRTNLKLARIGINEFDVTVYHDSIPYRFVDTKSNAGLFLDKDRLKLYSYTSNDGEVALHSLSYPPILASEVFQDEPDITVFQTSVRIIIGIFVAGLIFGAFLWYKKHHRAKSYGRELGSEMEQKEELASKFTYEKCKRSAIYVFGGFQVFDKDGIDVTAHFTPTLKQLFLLILLYDSKNEKGISSNKLAELLWSDKIGESARNNRNVNISKLRIVLERIGNINLSNHNTYWKIEMGNDIFCDYTYLFDNLDQLSGLSESEVYKFLRTISVGEVCPDIETEWMDEFKRDIENRLIDGLEELSKKLKDSSLQILLADTILKFAPLNEEAISLKCSTLFNLGKKGLAKKAYDNFCNEYYSMLDTKYDITFKDIIHR